MLSTASLLATILAVGFMAGEWPTYPVAKAPAELQPLIQHADLVIVSLQSAVLRELNAAIAEGGPEHALKSCHVEPAALALAVSRHEGVTAGRTSVRLRNPRNVPPVWAAAIVAQQQATAARDAGGFVVDLGERVGVLRPIVEQTMCAACHGPADRIPPSVKVAIAARYPADRAVNFNVGDLRGWFWVEVPKQARAR